MNAIIFANGAGNTHETNRLHGMTFLERHLRTLKFCDVQTVIVVFAAAKENEGVSLIDSMGLSLNTRVVNERDISGVVAGLDAESVLLVDADYVIEKSLIKTVTQRVASTILVDSKPPVDNEYPLVLGDNRVSAGCAWVKWENLHKVLDTGVNGLDSILEALYVDQEAAVLDIASLPSYDKGIRRHRRGFWMRPTTAVQVALAKDRLLDGTQKGGQDLPAKWLHAPIENRIVLYLSEYSITPNQLTLINNIVAWLVTWAILSGHVGWGLVGAAVVGVLDGVDGKLARLKLMTSKIGEFEHVFDMAFEYSWWLALGLALGGGDISSVGFIAGVALVLCNFIDHIIAILFWFLLGRKHERTIDNYTPFDLWFRKIAGRRNIYVWILLLTGPFIGLHAALWTCVGWGIATVFIRGGRMFWHVSRGYPPMEFEIVFK